MHSMAASNRRHVTVWCVAVRDHATSRTAAVRLVLDSVQVSSGGGGGGQPAMKKLRESESPSAVAFKLSVERDMVEIPQMTPIKFSTGRPLLLTRRGEIGEIERARRQACSLAFR